MNVTEIRIRMTCDDERRKTALLARASVVIDNEIALHEVKLIQGNDRVFVTMPNNRVTAPCDSCSRKNPVMARYCNWCGITIGERPAGFVPHNKLYRDVAHPISAQARRELEDQIVKVYLLEEDHRRSQDYRYDWYVHDINPVSSSRQVEFVAV